jgi:outer membrane protein assembly factor BamB
MKVERFIGRWNVARSSIGVAAALAVGIALVVGGGCSSGADRSKDDEHLGATRSALGTVNWLSRGFDFGRTSANTFEGTLTQANVANNSFNFGKLFDLPVDDSVYAQVLYASAVRIGRSSVNVIYLATVNNSVYAFNADTGARVWSNEPVNLNNHFQPPTTGNLNAGAGCNDLSRDKQTNSARTGIVGTPVIDSGSSTLYVVTRILEGSGIVYRLWALDIATGNLKKNPGTLVNPGNANIAFNATYENQRPGLAFSQGVVYAGFAGNCDGGPYHGWLVAFDGTTLQQTGWFATTGAARAGDLGAAGGIWMGGEAPAFDSSGNIYVATGNGTMPPGGEYAESVVKLAPRTLAALDYFIPNDYAKFGNGATSGPNHDDEELGSAGPTFLPGRNRVVQIGKLGILYLLSPSGLGGASNGIQEFQATVSQPGQGTDGFHVFGGPVAWVSDNPTDPVQLYVWSQGDYLRAYRYRDSTGMFDTTPFATTQGFISSLGGNLSLSSNGVTSGTGILWGATGIQPQTLYALNPDNLSPLWSSNNYARDSLPAGSRFHPPSVANGKVYVGSFANAVSVYGLAAHAHVTALYANGEFVLYPDTHGQFQALTCATGLGCWSQQTVNTGISISPQFPITSFGDGTTGHFFFETFDGFALGEFDGRPPSSAAFTQLTNGVGYFATPQSHSSIWDGGNQHLFVVAEKGDGTLHELYKAGGTWFDHGIPQCSYSGVNGQPSYVTAYWDGVQHAIHACVNPQTGAQELWETYNSGQWFTQPIASSASGGSVPYGQFAGASNGGVEGILGIGPAGTNTLVYTSFSPVTRLWSSVPITVPSLSYNSTVVAYTDSAGFRYFFVGANGHVYSLASPGGQNTVTDLSSSPGQSSLASGVTNSVPWTSDLAGFFDGTNDHVFFVGADGFVHEFYGAASSPFSQWVEHLIGSGSALLP